MHSIQPNEALYVRNLRPKRQSSAYGGVPGDSYAPPAPQPRSGYSLPSYPSFPILNSEPVVAQCCTCQQGAAGPPGDDGDSGLDGKHGSDGLDGAPGLDGKVRITIGN